MAHTHHTTVQQRRGGARLSLALIVAFASLSACGGTGGVATPFPTIVVVGIDGLRGDHLGRSGYLRETSPFLDALAERSLAFDRAYAASSRSLTSYASLLTGLAPEQHRLWQDGGPALRADVMTLAGRLRERGFRTAAFVSTRRDWDATGLERGFDHFDAPSRLSVRPYRRGGETVASALAWLAEQKDDPPRLLFVQLEDPTKPLDPLPDAAARAVAGIPPDELVEFVVEAHSLSLGYFNYEHRHVLRLLNLYDGEVRSADAAVAQLYDGMRAGGGPGALWIVTSPHGMGLGNHFWDGAARQIYETQVRVPLFVHTPGGELPAGASDAVVSQLALSEAIVALAGGSQVPVADLLAADRTGALVQRGALGKLARVTKQLGRPEADPMQQDAWVEAQWKYLRHADGRELLFDVVADPYEQTNRAEDIEADTLARLRAALAAALTERGRMP